MVLTTYRSLNNDPFISVDLALASMKIRAEVYTNDRDSYKSLHKLTLKKKKEIVKGSNPDLEKRLEESALFCKRMMKVYENPEQLAADRTIKLVERRLNKTNKVIHEIGLSKRRIRYRIRRAKTADELRDWNFNLDYAKKKLGWAKDFKKSTEEELAIVQGAAKIFKLQTAK